jgi:hypothetical protein
MDEETEIGRSWATNRKSQNLNLVYLIAELTSVTTTNDLMELIHKVNKYFLGIFYMPDAVLGDGFSDG